MARLRIYDLDEQALALDLRDLLRLLAPRSLQANWAVSPVKSSLAEYAWFEATGEGGERLEALTQDDGRLSGSELAALAEDTRQVIWGEFSGSLPAQPGGTWVVIGAVDSTFYAIETDDEAVLSTIGAKYRDVRLGEVPVAAWPLRHPQ